MDGKSGQPPLVVVAGQIPPPTGGQNVMIRRILDEVSQDSRWRAIHLPFYFTPSFSTVRRLRLAKLIELVAVWFRFLRLVIRWGRPSLLLYPSGGPQTVPVVRDVLLLPLFCALSRRVIVQFHAAGIAGRLGSKPGVLGRLLRFSYRPVSEAVVMTDFNRCDPVSLGIGKVHVIPHRLPDENPGGKLPDYPAFCHPRPDSGSPVFNILYAGHLYDLKGVPQLIEAFGMLAPGPFAVRLILMGEFLPPYTERACRDRIREIGIADRVEITGVLGDSEKAGKFRESHLFVFPSIAPYESFGLVMAEAMMWGLPIVATDWRGNRDVAGPDASYVPADRMLPAHLARLLGELLTDPAGLSTFSKASRQRYEARFRLADEESDYRNLLARILSR